MLILHTFMEANISMHENLYAPIHASMGGVIDVRPLLASQQIFICLTELLASPPPPYHN